VPASQRQHALAAPNPDDEPAFREYDLDSTGFGPRWRGETSHTEEQGHQRNVFGKPFHALFPLKTPECDDAYL